MPSKNEAPGSKPSTATTTTTEKQNKQNKREKAPLYIGTLLYLLSKTCFMTKELPC